VDNVVRSLLSAGMTWKSYNEGLPHAGDPRLYIGPYMRAHNPLSNFSDACAPGQRVNSAPFEEFSADVRGQMANFVYLDPNVRNDLHSGSFAAGDAWLKRIVPQVLARPEFQAGGGGQLWIAFDEGELKGSHAGSFTDHRCGPNVSNGCGGRLLLAVVGPRVKRGARSAAVYHQENLLSTWTRALGIAAPNGSADAATMADLFE
jgi:phosphatidylinositol-3-phosphatase